MACIITFNANAYRRASQIVRSLPDELQSRIAAGFHPDTLPGIGEDLADKIRAFVRTGELPGLAQLRRSLPAGLRDIMSVQNIGPRRVRALYDALGVRDLQTLRTACAEHRVREVRGFGAKTEERLAKALEEIAGRSRRLLRSVAAQYADALQKYLRALPGVTNVAVAGSFRRGRETVGDLDFLFCCATALDAGKALLTDDQTASLLAQGPTRSAAILKSGLQVDVRVVPPESYGAALYYFTGSKAHNVHVLRLGMARGLKVNEYGVFRGQPPANSDSDGHCPRRRPETTGPATGHEATPAARPWAGGAAPYVSGSRPGVQRSGEPGLHRSAPARRCRSRWARTDRASTA